jgi:predicted phosphodiesterase
VRRKDVKLEFGKKKTTTVISTSCWHYGNPSVSQEGIHKLITKCKKHQWLHHGDIIEGITKGDRRHAQDEHKDSLLYEMQQAAATIEKANQSCIGLIKGNHDETPSTEVGDVVEDISIRAKVPYLSATCYLNFIAPKGKATGFFAHGSGGSNPRAGDPERKLINRQVWLRNLLSQFDADICGIGHTHRFTVTPPCYEEKLTIGDEANVKREPILTRPTWYYTAPSMFTTYDLHADTSNYAEMKLYGATDIGWIETVFNEDGTIPCIREVYSTGKTKQEWYPRVVG